MAKADFGLMLQPTPKNFPGRELFDFNRQLIRALPEGFTTLWAEDHLEWGEEATLECLTTIAYFAAEFPLYHVGSLVMSQAYRNPALLAKMMANLQLLSGGRLILGLGAGWKEEEYRAYGYSFPDTRTRLEQLAEAAAIIKAMWTKQPATFIGDHYRIHNAWCEPQPDPPVPLLIGGGGEQRTLAIVARYADWYNFNSVPVEQYAHKVAVLKEHCAKIGRDPNTIRLTYLSTLSLSEDPSKVMRSPDKHFIAGNSAEVIRELEQFCAVGVSHFILRVPDVETLALFGKSVVPHFRG
ncbi:MAG TPA: LLM class flavin-dependent oxidoreductase [Ktedonobacteraceae bacterium]|nr:LLM class flavin-dependent oxidoreductase [Ktedonobacteraceae bacterium]